MHISCRLFYLECERVFHHILSITVAAGLCVRNVIDGDRLPFSGQFKN